MLGHQLLADPALAFDQHRGARRRHHLDRAQHLLQHGRAGEDVGGEVPLDLEAQAAVLALEERLLARLLHPHPELLEVRGLGEVVEGAEAHGVDRRLHVGEAGHDDRLQVGVLLADAGEDVDPVGVGQLEVEEEHVPLRGVERLEGALAGGADLHLVARLLEEAGHGQAEGLLVLGDEHAEAGGVHACPCGDVEGRRGSALPPFAGPVEEIAPAAAQQAPGDGEPEAGPPLGIGGGVRLEEVRAPRPRAPRARCPRRRGRPSRPRREARTARVPPAGIARAGVHGEGHHHLLQRVGVDARRRAGRAGRSPGRGGARRPGAARAAAGRVRRCRDVGPVPGRGARGVEQEPHDRLAARDLRRG